VYTLFAGLTVTTSWVPARLMMKVSVAKVRDRYP
jgi:hypothetical protein